MSWAITEKGYSQRRACRLVGIDPRVYRYRSARGDDAALRRRLRELPSERRRLGYRRLHILLGREGWEVNWKKLYRIYREERLTVRKRGGRKRALGTRAPMAIPQGHHIAEIRGYGGLCPDDGGARLRRHRAEDHHDRRDLPEGSPHGFESAGEKGGPYDQRGRLIGRTKGGLNTKLHAVTDAKGRPLKFFMTAGQVSDYTGAAALLGSLPAADWMIADTGYDADWFHEALKDKGIRPRIPARNSRGKAVRYDKRRYKRRNRIEIMFGRLKD
jgi:transposase